MSRRLMMTMTALLVLAEGTRIVYAQQKTDFSGTWKLMEYRYGDKVMSTKNPIVSGAPLNCGVQCTITQTAESLTVSRKPSPSGETPRGESVFLDGRSMANRMTATLAGPVLRLTQAFAHITVTQTVVREGNKLIMVTTVAESPTAPYSLTYERSPVGR